METLSLETDIVAADTPVDIAELQAANKQSEEEPRPSTGSLEGFTDAEVKALAAELGAALDQFFPAYADTVVICDRLGGAEMTLSQAVNAIWPVTEKRAMLEEGIDSVVAEIQRMLDNQPIKKEEQFGEESAEDEQPAMEVTNDAAEEGSPKNQADPNHADNSKEVAANDSRQTANETNDSQQNLALPGSSLVTAQSASREELAPEANLKKSQSRETTEKIEVSAAPADTAEPMIIVAAERAAGEKEERSISAAITEIPQDSEFEEITEFLKMPIEPEIELLDEQDQEEQLFEIETETPVIFEAEAIDTPEQYLETEITDFEPTELLVEEIETPETNSDFSAEFVEAVSIQIEHLENSLEEEVALNGVNPLVESVDAFDAAETEDISANPETAMVVGPNTNEEPTDSFADIIQDVIKVSNVEEILKNEELLDDLVDKIVETIENKLEVEIPEIVIKKFARKYLVAELEKIRNIDSDQLSSDTGTHEAIKQLLLGAGATCKSLEWASAIGRHAIQLYSYSSFNLMFQSNDSCQPSY